ncbi:2Fe-2S iron-sulfur cluster binding domain-containing protein [Rudanella paleaurantiibacter]|uniref:2Fe-2S iron-sulfur cluster binding domain-containing protein n=1 Tax=Rudanella paleaurantiibacter TaxID=2614655 RepID=A0A7J5TUE8_9BACT|nr:2Fe-2S iron-sulfur cluster-binding protein [Rudanella paleaurantiibacter]KAB7727630.1 2Fe-2S iron-sulfur cluster binding domain-containing protein [Rudanella paleaurantiibacter]
MPKVTYIETSGKEHLVDLPLGATLMEGAVQNDVKGIVAECGGSCMCATCHVYVDDAFLDRLPDMEEEENEMLDGASAERRANSRLGCQVRISNQLDGLIVRIPDKQ